MKNNFLIAIVFFSFRIFSQDTICFVSGTKLAATVKEIYPLEIKYIRFATDGPLYSEKKTGIKYIRYANGTLENFNTSGQVKTESSDNTLTRMELISGKFYYKNGELTYDKLWPLIYSYPNETIKTKLVTEFNNAKQYKKRKMTAMWFGLGAAYLGIQGLGYLSNYNNNVQNQGRIFVGLSAVIIGGSIYFAIDNKNKEAAKRQQIKDLYNNGK